MFKVLNAIIYFDLGSNIKILDATLTILGLLYLISGVGSLVNVELQAQLFI